MRWEADAHSVCCRAIAWSAAPFVFVWYGIPHLQETFYVKWLNLSSNKHKLILSKWSEIDTLSFSPQIGKEEEVSLKERGKLMSKAKSCFGEPERRDRIFSIENRCMDDQDKPKEKNVLYVCTSSGFGWQRIADWQANGARLIETPTVSSSAKRERGRERGRQRTLGERKRRPLSSKGKSFPQKRKENFHTMPEAKFCFIEPFRYAPYYIYV